MRMVDIIAKKLEKKAFSDEEIRFFIENYTNDAVPDYQASAWCMAVFLNGMTDQEATALTLYMAHSGDTLNLRSIAPLVVDKHSTGCVGDKTTLVVAPLVAATGLPVGKMSGRGLGFSGGTIDKLESFTGFKSDLSTEEFMDLLRQHNIVVSGQSADLAPADGKLYALRDVTATVPSLPLIASSIMSKKIAAGADAIVLDVKVGRGAFMKTLEEAEELAQLMVNIGRGVDREVSAIIADMDQPLGHAVGNILEVKEAIETLQGGGPADFKEHCLTVAGKMIQLGQKAESLEEAQEMLDTMLQNGQAWDKFKEWIIAQHGDPTPLENPSHFPEAPHIQTIFAPQTGYIAGINAEKIGQLCVALGGGRAKKGDDIDHRVGLIHHAKVGDHLEVSQPLLTLHAGSSKSMEEAITRAQAAITWQDEPVTVPPHILKIIG